MRLKADTLHPEGCGKPDGRLLEARGLQPISLQPFALLISQLWAQHRLENQKVAVDERVVVLHERQVLLVVG